MLMYIYVYHHFLNRNGRLIHSNLGCKSHQPDVKICEFTKPIADDKLLLSEFLEDNWRSLPTRWRDGKTPLSHFLKDIE